MGGGAIALTILGFATCSSTTQTEVCPTPVPGSQEADLLADARQATRFALVYPCYLPNSQVLESHSVTGELGRQRSELVFDGPFEMTIRQALEAPPVSPDPTGASRISIQLFDGVQASLIERNDGTAQAMYHLYWERNNQYFELQAFGPPQQRQLILRVARSLQ